MTQKLAHEQVHFRPGEVEFSDGFNQGLVYVKPTGAYTKGEGAEGFREGRAWIEQRKGVGAVVASSNVRRESCGDSYLFNIYY